MGGRRPTFAYVVLSHTRPEQVLRLVAAIRALSPSALVLISHDERHTSFGPLPDDPHVSLVGRTSGDWGTFSIVRSTIEAMERLRADADWVVVCSGQDFPVRDLAEWERGVVDEGVDAVLGSSRLMPLHNRWGSGRNADATRLDRYTHRWIRLPHVVPGRGRIRRKYRTALQALVSNARPLVGYYQIPRGRSTIGFRRLRTPFTETFRCYNGAQWLAAGPRAIDAVLSPVGERLADYFQPSLLADEAYFHTVIRNDDALRVRHQRVSKGYFPPGSPHPATATPELIERTIDEGSPFARKFDATCDHLLDDLERRLGIGGV